MKNFLLTGLLSLGMLGTFTMTSCNRDECKDVVCSNGGSCDPDNGDCICATGYEGNLCDEESREKFVGTWSASETVNGTPLVYSVTVVKSTNVTDVIISNDFSDDFFNNNISAVVDGNTITIPEQRPDGNLSDFRVQGSGTFNANRINWTYTITRISTNSVQTYTGSWQ